MKNRLSCDRCLLSGLFTNVAELQKLDQQYETLSTKEKVAIHPTSMLHNTKSSYLIYTDIIKTGKNYMHNISNVSPTLLFEEHKEYFRKRHIKADSELWVRKK